MGKILLELDSLNWNEVEYATICKIIELHPLMNVTEMAEVMGVTARTMYRSLREYGLNEYRMRKKREFIKNLKNGRGKVSSAI